MKLKFSDAFWNAEFTNNAGYGSMQERLKDGRKACKSFEEMLKQRAYLEETYGKGLLVLSKKAGGQTEINTIRSCFMTFKQQLENLGQDHMKLALELTKEQKRMEDFRIKQKDRFTKMDSQMSGLHKYKQTLFKKLTDSKRSYETKCRDLLDAECNRDRMVSNLNPKLVDKSKQRVDNCHQAMIDADAAYKQSLELIERTRNEWEVAHERATELYEQLEVERLNYVRNAMWVHSNQLSQQCVHDDQTYEEVRLSLEKSDVQDDINCFVKNKQTGERRPVAFVYEGQRITVSAAAANSSRSNTPLPRPVLALPKDNPPSCDLYASVGAERGGLPRPPVRAGEELRLVTHDFTSRGEQEMSVSQGDVVTALGEEEAGWALVTLNGIEGFVPANYLEPK